MPTLDSLLAQLPADTDPQVLARLRAEIRALEARRGFGLNFERSLPETVELPGRPVRRGDKVRVLPARGTTGRRDMATFRVTRVAHGVAHLVAVDGARLEVPVADVVVVAEPADTLFPGLHHTGTVATDPGSPAHMVINGENHHALQALTYTHEAAVDLIYIDPPYNTGSGDWIYNDKYVNADDDYRHSKWLAFMERRLLLARRLLKDTGIIIVAIGDDEHHRLRMLLDQTFGAHNFISDVVWTGEFKNDSRYVSNGADYMLIYAKSEVSLSERKVRWREQKPGVDEVLTAGRQAWKESKGEADKATAAFKLWWKRVPKHHPASHLRRYGNICAETGRVFSVSDIGWPGGGGPRYEVVHPITKKPVPVPKGGWRFGTPKSMRQAIQDGRVLFREDHMKGISKKTFLDETTASPIPSAFNQARGRASVNLARLLGEKRFPFPKDHTVLARWFRMVAPKDAVILDFFGGSGSTLEAVLRLNAEDGGTRQCVLVTNNELAATDQKRLTKEGHRAGDPAWEALGVHDYVTRPRVETLLTGVRPDGSEYADTVPGNVVFTRLTYENGQSVAYNRAFTRVAWLLWLKAGATGSCVEHVTDTFAVADTYGVLFDLDHTTGFVQTVEAAGTVRMVFVVTDDDAGFQTVCARLPLHVEPVRLYESYLSNFRVQHGG